MTTIWGFDLGVTSIGFAVIVGEDAGMADATGRIVRLGVRIFPEAREPDKSNPPKNVARRQARLVRRQVRRRRWRRIELRRILAQAGLIADERAVPAAGLDPYALRARGLNEALTPAELGWAMFHLLKRRGSTGSRKYGQSVVDAQKKNDDEANEAKASSLTKWLHGRILSAGLATIAPTIDTPDQTAPWQPPRRRDVGQTRAMVTDEFDALWRAQLPYHAGMLTGALHTQIEATSLWQRPTYFRRRTIGHCNLEPAEERALKADWLTQQFEMLQLVNALRLEGGNQRELDAAEREIAIAYLQSTREPTWAGLRRALGFPRGAQFTHERGKKESVRGNATEAALRAALGSGFPAHPAAGRIRDAIGTAWHLLEYKPARHGTVLEIRDQAGIQAERGRLAERAMTEWGLDAAQAAALAAIDLPHGTGRHSRKAMQRMMEHLEAGAPYITARDREYTVRESGAPVRFLPGPNMSEVLQLQDPYVKARMESLLAGIRNPTVLRALGELQKVVNTLLRVPGYGRPDLIRIEFARELKQSNHERRETDANQAKRETARKAARKKLAELGYPAEGTQGDENVVRLMLWEEQGRRCPYTGAQIGCADAFSGAATQIDHIFPKSRSLDDAQANKVLCVTRANRDKGDSTPFEYLSAKPQEWAYLTETLWPQMRAAGWPDAKRRRCLRDNYPRAGEDGFSQRQLVDTSYIARAARDYLALLFGGGQDGMNAVQVVPGRATAQLRRAWGIGLSRLLHGDQQDGPKIRDDHRHHAVDALAVALTGPRTVQLLAAWWQQRESGAPRPIFAAPWTDFHVQARAAVADIVVSHRVQAKLSGPLHEDTRLGDTGETRGKSRLFVKRKSVSSLTAGDVEAIRDPVVKVTIQTAIEAAGGNIRLALARDIRLPRKDGTPGPLIRRVRILMPRADGVMRVHPTKNIHAELGPGTTAHMVIYQDSEGVSFRVVSRRDAMAQARAGSGHIAQAPALILRPNDVLHRNVNGKDEYRLVRKFLGSGAIFYKPLTLAIVPKPETSSRPGPLLADGWRKVAVDPVGRVKPAQ